MTREIPVIGIGDQEISGETIRVERSFIVGLNGPGSYDAFLLPAMTDVDLETVELPCLVAISQAKSQGMDQHQIRDYLASISQALEAEGVYVSSEPPQIASLDSFESGSVKVGISADNDGARAVQTVLANAGYSFS